MLCVFSITGMLIIILAERLNDEIKSLQHEYQSLTSYIPSNPHELTLIEEFLLTCGRLGYVGDEMKEALKMRQNLLEESIKGSFSKEVASKLGMSYCVQAQSKYLTSLA